MSHILRTPATRKLLPRLSTRTYYSYETPLPPPYPPTETAILSAALPHVPTLGWTKLSLRQGARDAGYLDVSTNLFPKAEFELVLYHLRTQRLGLKDRVQFPEEAALGVTSKVRSLIMERLRGNVEVGVQGRWQESTDFKDTEEFLNRRLEEARMVGGAWRNVREWMGFQGIATVNMARNFG
ncbi:unnamed protein product, partial [Aureobasidium mustum]